MLVAASAFAQPDAARKGPSEACFSAYEGAQTSTRAGRLLRARSELAACAETCPPVLRADCAKWQRELEVTLPRIAIQATAAGGGPVVGLSVEVDGVVVAPGEIDVDPGEHVVRVSAPGMSSAERRIVVATGHRGTESFQLEPAADAPRPPAAPPRSPGASRASVGPYVLGGFGAGAVVAAGVLSAIGWSDFDAMRSTCAPGAGGPGCAADRVGAVETKWQIAGVLAGAGVLALGGAVLWRLIGDRPTSSARVGLGGVYVVFD